MLLKLAATAASLLIFASSAVAQTEQSTEEIAAYLHCDAYVTSSIDQFGLVTGVAGFVRVISDRPYRVVRSGTSASGPWSHNVFVAGRYISTPDSDNARLSQAFLAFARRELGETGQRRVMSARCQARAEDEARQIQASPLQQESRYSGLVPVFVLDWRLSDAELSELVGGEPPAGSPPVSGSIIVADPATPEERARREQLAREQARLAAADEQHSRREIVRREQQQAELRLMAAQAADLDARAAARERAWQARCGANPRACATVGPGRGSRVSGQ